MIKKIITGLAVGIFMLMLVTPASASTRIKIKGNGYRSYNRVELSKFQMTLLGQTSVTQADVDVEQEGETGENEVKYNTGEGSDPKVETGDVRNFTWVKIKGGSNFAGVDDCGCEEDGNVDVGIVGNGAKSYNKVKLNFTDLTFVGQTSVTQADVDVKQEGETGENEVKGNTGDDVEVTTGDVTNGVMVKVTGGSNMALL